jgi:AcrR family transcriptional regulator
VTAGSSSAADRAAGRATAPNRRERARAATLEEIKQTAFELMREQGSTDVKFADIARAMGLTAPALYRYFADRDALLTALLVDSFNDLNETLAAARQTVPADELGRRLLVTCLAYRRWATDNPQGFALIFGTPIPGYAAPEDGPTTEAATRAMGNLEGVVVEAIRRGLLGDPLIDEVGTAITGACGAKAAEHGVPIPPATYQAMLHFWAALHGFTCLETYGQLHWLDQDARDELFVAQIRATALAAGLAVPPR